MLHMQARKAVAHEMEQLYASRARLVSRLQALTTAVGVSTGGFVNDSDA